MSLLKPAVEYLLRNPPPASHWSAHGFGFLRLHFTKTSRMHIWNRDMLQRGPGVAMIHNHSWTFRSEVVVGAIFNTKYQRVLAHTGTAMTFVELIDNKEVGSGTRWLEAGKTETFGGGLTGGCAYPRTYSQTHDEIHYSASWPGTVTVIEREFEAEDRGACVYWPTDRRDVIPQAQATTDDEVRAVCEDSLRRWF